MFTAHLDFATNAKTFLANSAKLKFSFVHQKNVLNKIQQRIFVSKLRSVSQVSWQKLCIKYPSWISVKPESDSAQLPAETLTQNKIEHEEELRQFWHLIEGKILFSSLNIKLFSERFNKLTLCLPHVFVTTTRLLKLKYQQATNRELLCKTF